MFEIGEDRCGAAMRLVVCRSQGGPFDDEAFVSGWRLGDLAARLASPGVSALVDSIRPDECVQADLIAMGRGCTMTVEPSGDPEWLNVTFVRIPDPA